MGSRGIICYRRLKRSPKSIQSNNYSKFINQQANNLSDRTTKKSTSSNAIPADS
ncbi:hypothetical protein IQ247_29635 [Plectonema cf. radiosum LEGE 06105]|uniref:Uncharacterized protein n=1 Tax=Plectonema cf. radiosum LEGE 06105 TaxID=945769 RepID=A0A8J7K497_9CYAN|nr:hypothetical protein [Plectonema radiosum]MBE9216766.1 hypothetical protein [Plectonema cf. radiosum LEGE 06105]